MKEIKVESETVVNYGDEVKALGDGKVGGYLVRFTTETDPDLTGDYFQKDTDFGQATASPILYHHGLDEKIGVKVIGQGSMKTDDVGIWIESQLEMRDAYEKAIYDLASKGKLGWSSGTASHLVRRQNTGKANKIVSWPLGLDASLTPRPAEPRNDVVPLKSIEYKSLFETENKSEVTPEAVGDTAVEPSTTKKTINKIVEGDKAMKQKLIALFSLLFPNEFAMKSASFVGVDENEMFSALLNANKAQGGTYLPDGFKMVDADVDKKLAEIQANSFKATVTAEVKAQLEAAAPAINKGMKANLNLKAPKGDTPGIALTHYIKTGDAGGIRTDEAYKTDYELLEGTQYVGQELCPTEIVKKIFELRDIGSVARLAGATVIQVGAKTVNVPFQKNREGVFVAPGEATAYDNIETQPFDKTAVTITKYTRDIPISEELLEDSVVDLTPYLTRDLGRALSLTENNHFISASTGAWYGSTKGLDLDAINVIGIAEVPELLGKLPAAYRDRACWLMTQATEWYIRGLNTAYQFPMLGNGGTNGAWGTIGGGVNTPAGVGSLIGFPVFNHSGLDALGTSTKPIMIGNFEAGYVICERRAMTIVRDPWSDIKKGEIHLLASARFGGGIVVAEAFQHALHPSA